MDIPPAAFSRPPPIPLPLAAATGAALAFYPGPAALPAGLALALLLASSGIVLHGFGEAAARMGALLLAAALGAALGLSLVREVEGLQGLERYIPGRGLAVVGAVGRLAVDSSPARNGFRGYAMRAERLELAGAGISGELSWPRLPAGRLPPLRILARAGPRLDWDARLHARGNLAAGAGSGTGGAGGALMFASPASMRVMDRGRGPALARSALRGALLGALGRAGKRSSGLLEALILGSRDELEQADADAFKAAGCSHILALSGQHLSVLAALALALLKPLAGPFRGRAGAALLAALFTWVAGPGPSLLRAVLMAWAGALALALDRPQPPLAVLALAFLVQLPADPESARSLSFTLSYLAMLGLCLPAPSFAFQLDRWLPPPLSAAFAASLGAQAAVAPLLAFSFGSLVPAAIFASIAAGPLVLALMWWGMGAAAAVAVLPAAAGPAAVVSDLLYDILLGVMRLAARAPALTLPGPAWQAAAGAAVVALAAFVYARPHAQYRAWLRARRPA